MVKVKSVEYKVDGATEKSVVAISCFRADAAVRLVGTK